MHRTMHHNTSTSVVGLELGRTHRTVLRISGIQQNYQLTYKPETIN